MTITEANAVNRVLRWVFNSNPTENADPSRPNTHDLRLAAEVLATNAYKALKAGITPADTQVLPIRELKR